MRMIYCHVGYPRQCFHLWKQGHIKNLNARFSNHSEISAVVYSYFFKALIGLPTLWLFCMLEAIWDWKWRTNVIDVWFNGPVREKDGRMGLNFWLKAAPLSRFTNWVRLKRVSCEASFHCIVWYKTRRGKVYFLWCPRNECKIYINFT